MVLRLSYHQGVVAHPVLSTNVFILDNRTHIIASFSSGACFVSGQYPDISYYIISLL